MSDPIRLILAGNAVVTVENTATGNRFTFKVRKPDDTKMSVGWPATQGIFALLMNSMG